MLLLSFFIILFSLLSLTLPASSIENTYNDSTLTPNASDALTTTATITADYTWYVGTELANFTKNESNQLYEYNVYFGCMTAGCNVTKSFQVFGQCINPYITVTQIETDYEYRYIYINDDFITSCEPLNNNCTYHDITCIDMNKYDMSNYITANSVHNNNVFQVTFSGSIQVNNTCAYSAGDGFSYYVYGSVTLGCQIYNGITNIPTLSPSPLPSNMPTNINPYDVTLTTFDATDPPTKIPASIPTLDSGNVPTLMSIADTTSHPTSQPSKIPFVIPTIELTKNPISPPPTDIPMAIPSIEPTDDPTLQPSNVPTTISSNPTLLTSVAPTSIDYIWYVGIPYGLNDSNYYYYYYNNTSAVAINDMDIDIDAIYGYQASFGCSFVGCSVTKVFKIIGECTNPWLTLTVIETDYSLPNAKLKVYINNDLITSCEPLYHYCSYKSVTCDGLNTFNMSNYVNGNWSIFWITLDANINVNKCSDAANDSNAYYVYGTVSLGCDNYNGVTRNPTEKPTNAPTFDYIWNIDSDDSYPQFEVEFGCQGAGCNVTKMFEINGRCINPWVTVKIRETDYYSAQEYVNILINGRFIAKCNELDMDCKPNSLVTCEEINRYHYLDLPNKNSSQSLSVTFSSSSYVNQCPYTASDGISYYVYGNVIIGCDNYNIKNSIYQYTWKIDKYENHQSNTKQIGCKQEGCNATSIWNIYENSDATCINATLNVKIIQTYFSDDATYIYINGDNIGSCGFAKDSLNWNSSYNDSYSGHNCTSYASDWVDCNNINDFDISDYFNSNNYYSGYENIIQIVVASSSSSQDFDDYHGKICPYNSTYYIYAQITITCNLVNIVTSNSTTPTYHSHSHYNHDSSDTMLTVICTMGALVAVFCVMIIVPELCTCPCCRRSKVKQHKNNEKQQGKIECNMKENKNEYKDVVAAFGDKKAPVQAAVNHVGAAAAAAAIGEPRLGMGLELQPYAAVVDNVGNNNDDDREGVIVDHGNPINYENMHAAHPYNPVSINDDYEKEALNNIHAAYQENVICDINYDRSAQGIVVAQPGAAGEADHDNVEISVNDLNMINNGWNSDDEEQLQLKQFVN